MKNRVSNIGTITKYPGCLPINTPNLPNDLFNALSTKEIPQVICNNDKTINKFRKLATDFVTQIR